MWPDIFFALSTAQERFLLVLTHLKDTLPKATLYQDPTKGFVRLPAKDAEGAWGT
jgi:hypothetical protein